MSVHSIPSLSETSLDTITGGTNRRPAPLKTMNFQKTNNSTIILQCLCLNAPVSGGHNVGGVALSVAQGIS